MPENTPQTFCARMHVVAKHNGDPRRVVDFTGLNAISLRQTHATVKPFDLAVRVPPNAIMSKFDCWNGYHSVPVDERDVHYLQFITPWGRYRYKKAPQGYISSGDVYNFKTDEILVDVENHLKIVDDSLIYASNMADMYKDTVNFIRKCGESGMVLNKDKFKFAVNETDFAGFTIGNGKVKPMESHVEAIRNFEEPANITDLRSFMAMCEQVAYATTIKDDLFPLRELLKKDGKQFYWDSQLSMVFKKIRNKIADNCVAGIQNFDLNKITTLETDWSQTGMGFWLWQKYCACDELKLDCCRSGWRITMVGSAFCSPAESRYAAIEGELAAIKWALHKTKAFTLGAKNLIVCTDHKPLTNILKNLKSENESVCISRLKNAIIDW